MPVFRSAKGGVAVAVPAERVLFCEAAEGGLTTGIITPPFPGVQGGFQVVEVEGTVETVWAAILEEKLRVLGSRS